VDGVTQRIGGGGVLSGVLSGVHDGAV